MNPPHAATRTDITGREETALVIALIILLVLTAIGIFAVSTSTVETRIAGVERAMEASFYAADGGVEYGRRLLAWVLSNPTATGLPAGATVTNFNNFMDEVFGRYYGDAVAVPTVTTTIGGIPTQITIERLRYHVMAGSSHEFALPESEITEVFYYRIDARTSTGANASLVTTYRRVQTRS